APCLNASLSAPPPIGNVTPNTGAFTTLAASDERSSLFPVIDVRAYGAVGDAVQVNNCSGVAGMHTINCADPLGKGFTSASVGKLIGITQAGTSDGYENTLITTISSFNNAN